jgi:hypothetical protein
MNRVWFTIIFILRHFFLFPSAYRYIRYCDSYALNFLRSPEKVSDSVTLRKVFLIRIIVMRAVAILLVRLAARSLPLLVDIVAHSVIYTR